MADIQALLTALNVFNGAPDKAAIESANVWLQDFQHSPEAWSTCNVLLLSPEAPPSAKLFASQTFRSKVTYDLNQVDVANLLPLRDTLFTALEAYQAGPRAIVVQLCLALSGLALQLPRWVAPVRDVIDRFGRTPAMVPTLLEFLKILPEEVSGNTRIPITDEEYKERSEKLLTANAKQVLDLLALYVQAPGVTQAVQSQVFDCLRSWVVAGEIDMSKLAKSPLFTFAFEALASEEIFDAAVDVICEIIHETQEVHENMSTIELIVPRVIALKPLITAHFEDTERIKGYARIFAEAGETYRLLVLQHPETFFPIVEAIGECSAYPDLDVVPITFPFWMRLAQNIGKRASVSPLFTDAYKALLGVIIRHLPFPSDPSTLTGQEADSFRSFRHVMGDTLKDCCFVLGTDVCLGATYQLITTALSRSAESISWQEIEAPLFAMRSMGAEVDPTDNDIVPKIMDLIPSLPNHPRVRYAATLIISRYTDWINLHPDYIQFQLRYISAGFEDSDQEVCAAAGQALKYMCQDCKQHLVSFLPTLHAFLGGTGAKLAQDLRREVYEAIAYVISAMPMEKAAESLRMFALDILARVHAITIKETAVTKVELQAVGNDLESLETMLHVIHTFGDELPDACRETCKEAWEVFDAFLLKFGTEYSVAERTTRVLRYGVTLFGSAARSVANSVVVRMSEAFETTGFPSYLWIAGKIVGRFGGEDDPAMLTSFQVLYERSTAKVASLLQTNPPGDIPDVLEDYIQMLLKLVEFEPKVFYQSNAFPIAFRASMAALTIVHSEVIFAALDLFRNILTDESIAGTTVPPQQSGFLTPTSSAINGVVETEGFAFVGYMLSGLVGDFPADSTSAVVSIFRVLAGVWSTQLVAWLPPVLQQLPNASVPSQVKVQFLEDITRAVNSKQYDKVKNAIISLHRSSRKARDRRRTGVMDR